MDALDALKTKLVDKCIDSIDLLANGIKQNTFTARKDMERDARESSTGSHVKEPLRFDRKVTSKGQRIDNMKDQSLVDILDTRKVHILINLLHIQKMLNTQSRLIKLDVDIHSVRKRANLLGKLSNLRI